MVQLLSVIHKTVQELVVYHLKYWKFVLLHQKLSFDDYLKFPIHNNLSAWKQNSSFCNHQKKIKLYKNSHFLLFHQILYEVVYFFHIHNVNNL